MQTIKMTNRQAYDMLTLIERTIVKIEAENKADTCYYEQIKSIENAIHESCSELVDRWHYLQDLIKYGYEKPEAFTRACDKFHEWIDANE